MCAVVGMPPAASRSPALIGDTIDLLGHAPREARSPRECSRSARARRPAPVVKPAAASELHAQRALERAHVEQDDRCTSPSRAPGTPAQQLERVTCRRRRELAQRVQKNVRRRRAARRAAGRLRSPRRSAPARGASARRSRGSSRWRCPSRNRGRSLRRGHPDERLGVGAHEVPELVREPRQPLGRGLELEQQRHRAQHAAREDDVACREGAAAAARRRPAAPR